MSVKKKKAKNSKKEKPMSIDGMTSNDVGGKGGKKMKMPRN